MQYNETQGTLIGHVVRRRPQLDTLLIRDFLNQRVRTVLDRRSYWAGLLSRGIISVPASYSTGSIDLTNGSSAVSGTDTAWPTNDVVDTTVATAVTNTGVQTVTPASMSGITTDTVLYVDAAGNPEIVAVRQVTATTFTANFTETHSSSFTLIASSLAGRQLKLDAGDPIFTIRAVKTATSLEIDNEWGDVDESGSSYTILQIYYTLSSDVREILYVVDAEQGQELAIHVSQDELNAVDPKRSSPGSPICLADFSPNESGNMQYELYPHQTAARQLNYLYYKQWPDMKKPGDVPPSFINPNILIYGALSDALRTRAGAHDTFYDPKQADRYELMFERAVLDAVNADNSKALMALQRHHRALFDTDGADWRREHAVSDDDWD